MKKRIAIFIIGTLVSLSAGLALGQIINREGGFIRPEASGYNPFIVTDNGGEDFNVTDNGGEPYNVYTP